jgi:hypothetical protein
LAVETMLSGLLGMPFRERSHKGEHPRCEFEIAPRPKKA